MMGDQDGYDRQIEGRIEKLEAKMEDLSKWKNYILGGVATMGLLIGAYAKQVALIVRSILS